MFVFTGNCKKFPRVLMLLFSSYFFCPLMVVRNCPWCVKVETLLHTLSFSLSLTHTHSPSIPLTHSFSFKHTYSYTHYFTHTHSFSPLPLSLTHTHEVIDVNFPGVKSKEEVVVITFEHLKRKTAFCL